MMVSHGQPAGPRAELDEMKRLPPEGLEQGRAGMSSGPPTARMFADFAELVELCACR